MKAKLYFSDKDGDFCCGLEDIQNELRFEPGDKMEIWEAVKDVNREHRWCAEACEPILKGDGSCGKDCPWYDPRNGKNGCCKALRSCYVPGRKFILYKSGKLELAKE